MLAAKLADPADGSMVPFAATAGALAALTGLPGREVPGVRVLRPGYFDVTSEAGNGESVELGKILDGQDRPVGAMRIPLADAEPARTGDRSDRRWQVADDPAPAGAAHRGRHRLAGDRAGQVGVRARWARGSARVQITLINPADPESVPLSVNPLAPEPGYPVQAHIDMVRALFLAAFDAPEPFPQIMSQALQRSYEECGWDPLTGAGRADLDVPPAVPTLARLQAAALAVIDDVGYGRELQADMRGFVDVRLRSLRTGSAGRFFEGGHPADIGALLTATSCSRSRTWPTTRTRRSSSAPCSSGSSSTCGCARRPDARPTACGT